MFYKKLTTFLSLFISLMSCQNLNYSEEFKYYPDGSVLRKTNLLNNKKEGEMIDYYIDGKIKSICLFKNDFQSGRSIYYYQPGQIQEVQYYENNKQQLGDTTYYENGSIQLIMEFKDGAKNGVIQKFDTTGNIYFHATYQMDTLVAVNGTLISN